MRKNRYKKKTNKQKASTLLKKIKYWLYYEKKATPKLMIKNSVAFELFLEQEGLIFNGKEKTPYLLRLHRSGKYKVLNERCIRPRSADGKRKYKDYLQSDEWQKKRQEIFALRRRKCERCEKDLTNKMADVHHKTYVNIFDEKMEDLEVLCRPCHQEEHKDKKRPKKKKSSPVKKKTLSFRQKCLMLETPKGRKKLKSMGYNFSKKAS